MTILLNACVDLSVSKTDTPDPVLAGDEVTFTLTVTNNGGVAVPDVVVTDQLAPSTIRGGNPATGTVRLTCAPASDMTVRLSSSRWAGWLPARQITLPAGHPTKQFTVNTLKVTSPVDALITATANGTLKSATLHIVP